MACRRQPHLSAQTLYQQEQAAFQRGELPKALADTDRGIQAFAGDVEWSWRFRVAKAEVLVWQGKAKDALGALEERLPDSLGESDIAVRWWTLRGIANYQSQHFEESSRALDAAAALATAKHSDLLGGVAQARGTLAVYKRDYDAGKRFYLAAAREAERQSNTFLKANALGNLGFLSLRLGQYGEALDWSQQSLRVAESLGNRTQRSMCLGNIAWSQVKLGDYESALLAYGEAESVAAELGLQSTRSTWLSNIGSIHYQQSNYREAAEYYGRALEIARKLENRSLIDRVLQHLAATAIETRDLEQADHYNREALELERATGDVEAELYSLLNAARIAAGRNDRTSAIKLLDKVAEDAGDNNISLRWEAQAELGNLYASAHDNARADRQFRTALATVDKARAGVNKEEYRLSFLTSASRFYDDYVDFLVASKRTDEALKVAEHSRARTLAEGLGLKTTAVDVSIKPAAVASRRKAVLLYYWLAPKGSYLWAVSAQKTELFRLPPEGEIVRRLEEYQKALMGPRDVRDTANAAGQELYTMLVAPAQKSLAKDGRVIVIADGPLHKLNFETLLVPGAQPHYWIEDAEITNVNSIALLAAPRRGEARLNNLLLIGNPQYTGQEFPPLPQAAQEVKLVENHFAPELRLVLAQDQAKASAYGGSKAGSYRYIHFVAHATASSVSPLDSSIILTKDGDNAKLYARDIMQQPLSAELVTISACHSSGTKAYTGEGLVGLSWAFLRAGAHNVIAALWEVNDASTPQLMDTLYSEMGKGRNAASALRAAKLQMLHSDSVYRRPFYWAALQLYSGS